MLMRLFQSLTKAPRIVCDKKIWEEGVRELNRRTKGVHESGAFLLGSESMGTRTIKKFLFYDDIDQNCFDHGIVEFNGFKFGAVWDACRKLRMGVAADVHVHPYGCGQSDSDQENPMMLKAGHLAFILPNYASGPVMPGKIGIYEYLGKKKWSDHSRSGNKFFEIR